MNTIIQTFWSKPLLKKSDDAIKKYMIMAYASAKSIKEQGYYLKLYTDTVGKKLFENYPFDETITLNCLENENPGLFAAIKVFGLEKEPIGTVHIDSDIILTKPCIDITGSDVIVQCIEPYHYYAKEKNFLKKHIVPKMIEDLGLDISPYNVGVIGFNNQKIKDDYIKNYKESLCAYKDIKIPQGMILDFLFEQAFLPKLVKYHKGKTKLVLKRYKDTQTTCPGGPYSFPVSDTVGFYHYWGEIKRTEYAQNQFKKMLDSNDMKIIYQNYKTYIEERDKNDISKKKTPKALAVQKYHKDKKIKESTVKKYIKRLIIK